MIIDFVDLIVCPNCKNIGDIDDFLQLEGYVECRECCKAFYVYKLNGNDSQGNNRVIMKSSSEKLSEVELRDVNILSFHDVLARS